jgi:hypothetical protein
MSALYHPDSRIAALLRLGDAMKAAREEDRFDVAFNAALENGGTILPAEGARPAIIDILEVTASGPSLEAALTAWGQRLRHEIRLAKRKAAA